MTRDYAHWWLSACRQQQRMDEATVSLSGRTRILLRHGRAMLLQTALLVIILTFAKHDVLADASTTSEMAQAHLWHYLSFHIE